MIRQRLLLSSPNPTQLFTRRPITRMSFFLSVRKSCRYPVLRSVYSSLPHSSVDKKVDADPLEETVGIPARVLSFHHLTPARTLMIHQLYCSTSWLHILHHKSLHRGMMLLRLLTIQRITLHLASSSQRIFWPLSCLALHSSEDVIQGTVLFITSLQYLLIRTHWLCMLKTLFCQTVKKLLLGRQPNGNYSQSG